MAEEEDEIDVLGEFSFNSCLAQNDHGIPSCSGREDTVHPEWLMDSTANNWYDTEGYSIPPKSVTSQSDLHTSWSQSERNLLNKEMYKYGRDIKRISQKLTTKSEAEIQALIEAEYGVNLDIPPSGLANDEASLEDEIPAVQEEIVTDEDSPIGISKILNMVTTGKPTFSTIPKNKTRKISKRSILKPDALLGVNVPIIHFDSSELIFEDDLTLGSVECIGAPEIDSTDLVSKNIFRFQKKDNEKKPKIAKKIGNHRRKHSNEKLVGNNDGFNRQRKISNRSNESAGSPKLQIVLGSGQALPVSEGEQVIKIEKKQDSEAESDIEIDIDSDKEQDSTRRTADNITEPTKIKTEDVILPMRKFEPMPKRGKKFNLEGSGGCTIMHTEAGDLYEIAAEPRKDKPLKKTTIALIPCRQYTDDNPAPFSVSLNVSALLSMEVQAHCYRTEVMGLVGGSRTDEELCVTHYWPAAAAATDTHCDMCPVSQAAASEKLQSMGCSILGWHHSHPSFPSSPSAQDLRTQLALQQTLQASVAFITSQHWTAPRSAGTYKCIRVESVGSQAVGYRLPVRLRQDLRTNGLPAYLGHLRGVLSDAPTMPPHARTDLCPHTRLTYLEKCVSTVKHHLHSAGYADDDPLISSLIAGLRDVFR